MKVSASVAAMVLACASAVSAIGRHQLKTPPLSLDDAMNSASVKRSSPSRIRGSNNVWSSTARSADPLPVAVGGGGSPIAGSTNSNLGQGTFQQLIDHTNPALGTFSQSYWYNTEYWTGPGAPVVLFTPGEVAATDYGGYLTNRTITGLFAQAIGGAVIMFEHRYWGNSSPFADLTTKNLQYLTLANAIADATHFARSVQLPFDTNGSSNAPQAPWVLSGGSYSGALTAWVEHVDPGTFWAYHASSAVVQAEGNFWQYFEPIKAGLPKNCSADVQRVVKHVDKVLSKGTAEEVQKLKTKFGLGSLVHSDDFADVLANGPSLWQEHDFDTGYSSVFQFCDYIENAVPGEFNSSCAPKTVASEAGVGLKKALNGYAKWTKEILLPGYCEGLGPSFFPGTLNTACLDSHNASNPIYTDTTVNNYVDRQWTWLLCNEPFMYWQTAAPAGTGSLVPSLVDYDYFQNTCALYFPEEDGYTFGSAPSVGKTPDDVNAYTGGWSNTNTTRLIWANGQYDPWRDVTVSSDYRPGGPLASTADAPVNVIPGGIHCSDLIYANALANAGVMAIVEDEIATIKGWVEDFYKYH